MINCRNKTADCKDATICPCMMYDEELSYNDYIDRAFSNKGIEVNIYDNPLWVQPTIEIDTTVHDKEVLNELYSYLFDKQYEENLQNNQLMYEIHKYIEELKG